MNVLDYLLKPVSFERFLKASNKALDLYNYKNYSQADLQKFIFIKTNQRYEKIFFDDIAFIEARQNYICIHTIKEKFITHMTMKYIEELLSGTSFLRIHKSYIISTAYVQSIEGNELVINSHTLPISRDNKNEILNKILQARQGK